MCTDVKLSYNTFPAGHIFRLGVAILVLTGNCVVMRVAATVALLSIKESQAFCRQHETACSVTAFSVLGSVLPILSACLTGAFAIVAAKRYLKWAFIVTFALGCVVTTVSFLLNLLFNGLRHGFNIDPVLVPDILEINLFCVINLLAMVVGIMCVKALVRDRSERYAMSASAAAAAYGVDDGDDMVGVAETSIGGVGGRRRQDDHQEVEVEFEYDNAAMDDSEGRSGVRSANSLRPPSPPRHSGGRQDRQERLPRSASRLSGRSDSRVEAELTVVVENESGKVTNFDIFTVAGGGGGGGDGGGGRRPKGQNGGVSQ